MLSYRNYKALDGQQVFAFPVSLLPFTLAKPEEQIRVFVNGLELDSAEWQYKDIASFDVPLREYWDEEKQELQLLHVRLNVTQGYLTSPSIEENEAGLRNMRFTTQADPGGFGHSTSSANVTWSHNTTGNSGLLSGAIGWRTGLLPTLDDAPRFDPFVFWQYSFEELTPVYRMMYQRALETLQNPYIREAYIEVSYDNIHWLRLGSVATLSNPGQTTHSINNFHEIMDEGALDQGVPIFINEPAIEILTELSQGDEVVLMRETRFDRSWVEFTSASRLNRSTDAMNYYNQRLFILQEWCEIAEIAALIGYPYQPLVGQEKDDSAYSLLITDESVDLSQLELLPESTVGPPWRQLEVVSALGDVEVPFEFGGDDPAPLEWGWDDGVILPEGWGTEDFPVKVRRRTRKDQLWHTMTNASSFSSTQFRVIEKQIQFLIEESCGFPVLPEDHPLRNAIFPRRLNFVLYDVSGFTFYFGQFPWNPDSGVTVWLNDLILEDHEYSIDWPTFTVTIPSAEPGDKVAIGGGGFSGTGMSLSGSPTGDNSESGSAGYRIPADLPPEPVERWGVDDEGSVEPYGFFSIDDTPDGLSPTLSPPMTGLKYTAPGGQDIAIRVGSFGRCPADSALPAGVGRRRDYIQWTSTNGGESWSRSQEISSCEVGLLDALPAWAQAIRTHYTNQGGTIASLIQGLSSSAYSIDSVPHNAHAAQLLPALIQAKASGLDQMTGEQFADWLNGENPFE